MGDLRSSASGYHGANSYASAEIPAETQVGDLLVLLIGDRYLPSLPAGWTTVDVQSGTNQSGRLAWKIATDSDIGAGSITYILAGSGTGTWTALAFQAGSFNTTSPISTWWSAIDPSLHQATAYLPISSGQAMYHYVNAKVPAPAPIFGTAGAPVLEGREDPEAISALFVDYADSDTTLHQQWSSAATIEGAYKISFVVASPPGVTRFQPIRSVTYVMVATYDVALISPEPDEYLLDSTPVLQVFATGDPEPFQVQFEVDDEDAFGSPVWSQTVTGALTGEVGTQVGVALGDGQQYYWRARAGDGTTWGPWSEARAMGIFLSRSEAQEYLNWNVGAELVVEDSTAEFMHENIGLVLEMEDSTAEYLHENVGFIETINQDGIEYQYYSPVTDDIPTPHLWFAWRKSGFVNDQVLIYGQGLGTLASEYNGKLYIAPETDPPAGTSYITGIQMGIFDWSVQPATADAYGENRRISTGAAPFTNVETQIVEVTIPTAIAPTVEEGALNRFIQAITDGGPSNEIDWLAYPTIPTPAAASGGINRMGAVIRVGVELTPDLLIPQNWAVFETQPYILSGSRAVTMPAMGVLAATHAQVDSYDTRESLDAVLSVSLGATYRWVPSAEFIVPRADLGTGMSTWVPAQGGEDFDWEMQLPNAPYLNPAFVIPSRLGHIPRQAMVFEGDQWLTGHLQTAEGPIFTLAMVFVPHANEVSPDSFFYEMWSEHNDPNGSAATLRMQNQTLWHYGGRSLTKVDLPELGPRPIILMINSNGATANLLLVHRGGVFSKRVSHVNYSTQDLVHYIGLPANNQHAVDRTARIDLLDVAYWDSALSLTQMRQAATLLDGIYGITGYTIPGGGNL